MKANNINSLIKEYKNLERESHIHLDDTINKVTQEVAELVEAHTNWYINETYKESWDVLANLYSVSNELWIDINLDNNINTEKENNPIDLSILHWKWNSKIQALRWRYSREDINLEEAKSITNELVLEVLNYSDPESNIEEIIWKTLNKFKARVEDYKSNINVKDYITNCPNFPKPWIDFKDISPLLRSPEAFRKVCMELVNKCSNSDVIVWLDSRGFLFWPMVAEILQKPFVMVRKKWKLPWKTLSQDYWLEYWSDTIELQKGGIEKWKKVSVIDDLLATWGTAKAAINLIERSGWEVNNVSFIISLNEPWLINLESRKILSKHNINSIVNYY